MSYLELIVRLEEMLDNEEVNQFDEIDFGDRTMTYFELTVILDDLIADEDFNLFDEVDFEKIFEKSILTNKEKVI